MAIRMRPDGSMEFDTADEAYSFWSRVHGKSVPTLHELTPMQYLERIGDGRIARLVRAMDGFPSLDTDDIPLHTGIPVSAIPAAIRSIREFGERYGFGRDRFVVRTKGEGMPGSTYALTEKAKAFLAKEITENNTASGDCESPEAVL